MKKLLVAVDLTPSKIAGYLQALEIAKATGAQIELLHIWSIPVAPLTTNAIAAIERDARRELEELIAQYPADGVSVSIRLEPGDPKATIPWRAQNAEVDLIVLCTRTRGRVARAVLGGVTDSVLQSAPCPVLVVNESCGNEAKATVGALSPPDTIYDDANRA